MPMPPSGVRKFTRAMLVVDNSREILINDLSWDVKNGAIVEKTDGAVGVEDDTGPADVTASWQTKIAQGGFDYLTRVVTPGQRQMEITLRTADGTLECFGVLNSAGEKQPVGVGHTRSMTFAGIVTSWVKA